MTFKIGHITLPVDPQEGSYRWRADLKSARLVVQLPMLLGLGPQTPVLKLKGWLAYPGQTAQQMEDSYILPLRDMIWKPLGIPIVVIDDNHAAFWQATMSGSGTREILEYDETTIVKFGANSCKVSIFSGSYLNVGLYHHYTTAENWLGTDFYSFWWYGRNSSEVWDVIIECPNSSNKFNKTFTDDFTGWKRFVFHWEDFTETGSPDLEQVTNLFFWNNEDNPGIGDTYLDRVCAGVGKYIDGPGARYDGIHAVREFKYSESYKALNAFPYELELWLVDDFY